MLQTTMEAQFFKTKLLVFKKLLISFRLSSTGIDYYNLPILNLNRNLKICTKKIHRLINLGAYIPHLICYIHLTYKWNVHCLRLHLWQV